MHDFSTDEATFLKKIFFYYLVIAAIYLILVQALSLKNSLQQSLLGVSVTTKMKSFIIKSEKLIFSSVVEYIRICSLVCASVDKLFHYIKRAELMQSAYFKLYLELL